MTIGYSFRVRQYLAGMPAPSTPVSPLPQREIICADAIAWMRARGRIDGACAVTSLPDVSEIGKSLPVWREWFLGAVRLVVEAVPDESAALFFQSDIKRDGAWIDKGAMVIRAAQNFLAGRQPLPEKEAIAELFLRGASVRRDIVRQLHKTSPA